MDSLSESELLRRIRRPGMDYQAIMQSKNSSIIIKITSILNSKQYIIQYIKLH